MIHLEGLAIRVRNNQLFILDQQLLPDQEKWRECSGPSEMVEMIHQLKVRGAPLIGVAAALSLGLYAEKGASDEAIMAAAEELRASRPTAVNLTICIDRTLNAYKQRGQIRDLVGCAEQLFLEDVALCDRMSDFGAQFIQSGDHILTHCNTGGLATAGIGTALGVIRRAHEQGKKIHVYVDETRPLLQGGRLTTWELSKLGIPHTLICDNMAGYLMQQGRIQKVFVGADRIACNGDFANKVGTYSVAVLARAHHIPFYVVAPYTTLDYNMPSGRQIPIEERAAHEVLGVRGSFGEVRWAPVNSTVLNPAFDVTPATYVTALVLDTGVYHPQQIEMGHLKQIQRSEECGG